MSESKPQEQPSSSPKIKKSGSTEIFGGLLFVSGILLLFALGSFQGQINKGQIPIPEYNLIGSMGHYSAEVLFLMFGKSAFLLGPYFLLLGVLTIIRGGFSDPLARLTAILVMIVGTSILGALLGANKDGPSHLLGGLVGARMGRISQSFLGEYGAAIVSLGIIFVGIILAIRMPMSLFVIHLRSTFKNFIEKYGNLFSGPGLEYPSLNPTSNPTPVASTPNERQSDFLVGISKEETAEHRPFIEKIDKTEKIEEPEKIERTAKPFNIQDENPQKRQAEEKLLATNLPKSFSNSNFEVSPHTRHIQDLLSKMENREEISQEEEEKVDDVPFKGYFDPDGSRFHFRQILSKDSWSDLSSEPASIAWGGGYFKPIQSKSIADLEQESPFSASETKSNERSQFNSVALSSQEEDKESLETENRLDKLVDLDTNNASVISDSSELSDSIESADPIETLDSALVPEEYQGEPEQFTAVSLGIEEKVESLTKSLVPSLPDNYDDYNLSTAILKAVPYIPQTNINADIQETREALKNVLREYNIQADVVGVQRGPIITLYELKLEPGIKVSRVIGLQSEICMKLAVPIVRIIAPIPGKPTIGIEVPNRVREPVLFSQLLPTPSSELTILLGKNIAGENQYTELTQLPHLLIAGATGAGKSVYLNAVIASLLYQASPDDVRFVMIDPKMVELKLYEGIPHLLMPVITDVYEASKALRWLLDEMERRYRILSTLRCRDILSYNNRAKAMTSETQSTKMPYVVVLIDELSDLMMVSAKDVEDSIIRLTQKARAVGIHIVMATQRPSVDVITALIKANCPARVAFQVSQRTDSRTILDTGGAENLLGKGDLLYKSPQSTEVTRIQAPLISVDEIELIVKKAASFGKAKYVDFALGRDRESTSLDAEVDEELFKQALGIVLESEKTSTSYLQRRMRIGYNRAANLIEMMEDRGYLSPLIGNKPREITKRD